MGYEIIERTIDKKGQFLLVSDIEANVWWTNTGFTDREVIGHYHAHVPSEKFETNKPVLELAILSYNILRMIGQKSLGKRTPHQKRAVNAAGTGQPLTTWSISHAMWQKQ